MKPPLGLFLTSQDTPESELRLTNDFLLWKSERDFVSSNTAACVLIPVRSTSTNNGILFFIENNRAVPYEDVEISVVFSAEIKWDAFSPWEQMKHWPDGRTGIVYSLPMAIHDFESRHAPPIFFAINPVTLGSTSGTAGFVTVFIKAKDMKPVSVVFSMAVAHFSQLEAPILVLRNKLRGGFTVP